MQHTRLRSAALQLFAANGYEATTVDEIAQLAGMSRRTFFRYFSSKEDVIFPDHDALLAAVDTRLADSPLNPPVAAVCSAMRSVFESYLAEPEVALQRYQLTQRIATLRDREIASVSRYQRLLTNYLSSRDGESIDAALRAELMAAAVIAAHNHVLRRWLRRGCTGRPQADLDRAFDFVCSVFEPARKPSGVVDSSPAEDAGPSVVAVFRSSLSLEEIKETIHRIAD